MIRYGTTDDYVIGEIRQQAAWWQACPVCGGQKFVSKPPHVAGDQQTWSSDQATHKCPVCNGKGITNTVTGKSPK